LFAALGPVLLAAAGVGAPAPAAAVDGEVTVEITGVEPAYLTPDDPLVVTGTVRNGTTEAVADADVSLRLQRSSPISRRSLDAWLDTDNAFRTLPLAEQAVPEPLGAGAEVDFRLTVAAGGFPLSPSAWGPRGLEVRLTGTGADGATVSRGRTLTVWAPPTAARPTQVSLLVPLAPSAADLRLALDASVPAATPAEPRVRGLVAATQAAPEVAWALDPALLSTEPPLPEEPTTEPTPVPGVEPSLADVIRSAAPGRDVLALAYADADVAALVRSEDRGMLAEAVARGTQLLDGAGVAATRELAWPAGERTDLATVSALAAGGARAVVVPADVMEPEAPLAYTPTGRARVATDAGDVAALLGDGPLSAALGGFRQVAPAGDPTASDESLALDARQYLLASTAMITAERPSEPRAVLAVLSRSAAADVDVPALAERIGTLLSAPWVRPLAVSAFAELAEPDLARESLPAAVVEDGEAGQALLDAVARAQGRLGTLGEVVPDPTALVQPTGDVLLQVTGAAWREDPAARAGFAVDAGRLVGALNSRTGVVDSATVNLISSSGALPITVRNELDQPVRALLRLTSRDPALQVPEPVPVDVLPDSEQAVGVPVRAVGSADVTVLAELTTGAGERVGTSAAFDIRVRADWESVGTAVVAGIVGIAFVVGLVRNIRRGRRVDTAVAAPPAGEQSGTRAG
jgi:hypothetical protein